jgi:putative two-component system response regulator
MTHMTNTILLVDDEAPIRSLLTYILTQRGYACAEARDAAEARNYLQRNAVDLILSDINMPGESGLDFIRFALETYPDTAAIMVTAVDDFLLAESFLKLGIYDYINKPIEKGRVLVSVANAIHRQNLSRDNKRHQANLEAMVAERTVKLKGITTKLRGSLEGIIHAIAHIVEIRDPYTAGHQNRVAGLSKTIGVQLKLPQDQIEGIYLAGLIHDVGKIAVPSEILSKPSRLSDIEFSLIKTHSQVGFDILKDIDFPWPIAKTVHQHHERFDGSGYPLGLVKAEILMEARILSVADVVEAMASHRPYRAGLGIDKALAEITASKGKAFDPDVVDACLSLFHDQGYELEVPNVF